MKIGLSARIIVTVCVSTVVFVVLAVAVVIMVLKPVVVDQKFAGLKNNIEATADRLDLLFEQQIAAVLVLSREPELLGYLRARERGGVDPLSGVSEEVLG